VNQYHWSLW